MISELRTLNITLYRPGIILLRGMITRYEECDHVLVGDEVEHIYKGKSYCEDCYRTVRSTKISYLVLAIFSLPVLLTLHYRARLLLPRLLACSIANVLLVRTIYLWYTLKK
jgi:hypothetical protein